MQRGFCASEELTRHKRHLGRICQRDELHNGNLPAFEAITECGSVQLDVLRVSVYGLLQAQFLGVEKLLHWNCATLYDAITGIHEKDKALSWMITPCTFTACTQDVIVADDASNARIHQKNLPRPICVRLVSGQWLTYAIRAGQTLQGVICTEHVAPRVVDTGRADVLAHTLHIRHGCTGCRRENEQRTLFAELNRELLLVNTGIQGEEYCSCNKRRRL